MKGMEPIHQFRVQKPMHPIEIETLPNRDQEKDRDEPHRVGLERDGRNDPIGHGPPK